MQLSLDPNSPPLHWTIHDVAREAGVSAKTVSRVINNEPGVSRDTRLRVQEVVDKVGYQPHTGARSMRTATRDCVGLTVPAPVNEVPLRQDIFLWIFSHLYRIFGAYGDFLCFDLNPYSRSHDVDYARGVWQQRYGACVICGPLRQRDIAIHRIHSAGVPYVALSRMESLPECSSATVDYEFAAYMSTRYMLERGHKRVGMLQGFPNFQAGLERVRGYSRAMEEYELPVDNRLIVPVTFESESVAEAAHGLLAHHNVTALLDCSGMEDAAALRDGIRRSCRKPGYDFEALCWTYMQNAAVLIEACAHVFLPLREATVAGFEQLARWVHGESEGPISVLFRPELSELRTDVEVPRPGRLLEVLS